MEPLLYLSPHENVRIIRPQPECARRALQCAIDFFISYRISEAEAYARNLSHCLQRKGFRTFMAGEQDLPEWNAENTEDDYRKVLEAKLGLALEDSLILVCIGSQTFPDGYWCRWENEAFESGREGKIGREGKMFPIATVDTSAWASGFFRFLQDRDGAVMQEGDLEWRSQMPSDTVVSAALGFRDNFEEELEFELIAEQWPEGQRRRVFHQWLADRRRLRNGKSLI